MTGLWHRLNAYPRAGRWAWKIPTFGIVLVAVLFPDPRLLVRHVGRLARLGEIVNPNAPGLEDLQRELDPYWEAAKTPREKLQTVQKFVVDKIPYEWDWNTWLVMDYLPTVEEVLEKGKEDCDGRAVLAASLLAGRGYDAKPVANFAHMWVSTKHGETMHPAGRKAIEATERDVRIHWKTLADVPVHFSFGVAVFPLVRELILVVVLWGLLLRPPVRLGVAVVGLAFMAGVLGVWWYAAHDPRAISRWGCWMGFVIAGVGIALTVLGRGREPGYNSCPES